MNSALRSGNSSARTIPVRVPISECIDGKEPDSGQLELDEVVVGISGQVGRSETGRRLGMGHERTNATTGAHEPSFLFN